MKGAMSHFTFDAKMPKRATSSSLEEQLKQMEQRALDAEHGQLRLLEDMEKGFFTVCEFMKKNFDQNVENETTARWFTHVMDELKAGLPASVLAESSLQPSGTTSNVDPIPFDAPAIEKKFSESDANFLENTDFGMSGFAASPRGNLGNSLAFGNSFANLAPSVRSAPKAKPKRKVPAKVKSKSKAKSKKKKSKDYKKSSNFVCVPCNKGFSGASGLWYHNKHVHNAVTQLRPRNKNKKLTPQGAVCPPAK